MENHEAITRLKHLRDEVCALQAESRVVSDLRHWYNSVLDALIQIYGEESPAKRDFEQIPFGFPPETLQSGAEKLRANLQQHGIDVPESLTIPQDNYYQKPLREAVELLSSLISALRSR